MSFLGLLMGSFILLYLASTRNNGRLFFFRLMVVCLFQNAVLVLLAKYLSSIDYFFIVAIKEIYVYFILIKYYISKSKLNKCEFVSLIGILYLALLSLFQIIMKSQSIMAVIASYRQLSLLFLFYLLGEKMSITTYEEAKSVLCCWNKLIFIACVFGCVELLVGASFWEKLGIQYYTLLKNGMQQIIYGHYSYGGLYTYDLYPILGRMGQRMGSVLCDAVIFGQLLAFNSTILIFNYGNMNFKGNKLKKIFFIIIDISCLFLTFAKGGYLIFGLSVALLLYVSRKKHSQLLGIFSMMCLLIAIIFAISYSFKNGLSGISHMKGLFDGINNLVKNPFGLGIGMAGNLAGQFGDQKLNSSGESFIGTMLSQLGVPGAVLYLVFLRLLFKHKGNESTETKIIKILTISMIICSLVNNTAISFTSCFVYLIMLSMFRKLDRKLKYNLKTYDINCKNKTMCNPICE